MSASQQVLMDVGSGGVFGLQPLWSNVVLALHGDGTDGSTTIVDETGRASPTANRGTSAISTTQAKYGGASIKFNHDGGLIYKTGAADAAFQFAGDFMMRCWVYANSSGNGTSRVVWDTRASSTNLSSPGIIVFLDPTNAMSVYIGGNLQLSYNGWPTDQWVHLAVTRASGTLRLFGGGSTVFNVANSTNLTDGRCCIGEVNPEYQGTTAMNGYIDDFEIANGEAVYTAAYTPPIAAFPNS